MSQRPIIGTRVVGGFVTYIFIQHWKCIRPNSRKGNYSKGIEGDCKTIYFVTSRLRCTDHCATFFAHIDTFLHTDIASSLINFSIRLSLFTRELHWNEFTRKFSANCEMDEIKIFGVNICWLLTWNIVFPKPHNQVAVHSWYQLINVSQLSLIDLLVLTIIFFRALYRKEEYCGENLSNNASTCISWVMRSDLSVVNYSAGIWSITKDERRYVSVRVEIQVEKSSVFIDYL